VVIPTGNDRGDGTANPTHTWTTGVGNWSLARITGVNFRASTVGQIQPPVAAALLSGVLGVPSVGTRLTVPTP
jgi:hypothetical protein